MWERVLAPNPGPMTLEGTNTWLLHAGAGGGAVVVDPGPEHEGHHRAVLTAAEAAGVRIVLVLLTHGHADHAEGAPGFAARAGGVPVRALDPRHRLGEEGLADGDVVTVDDLELRVLGTPGHTADSVSLVVPGDGGPRAVLTGDTVLGRGSTVVAHPDGELGPYLDSLHRLADLGPATVLPGHGPVLPHAGDAARDYLAHRERRLAQVRAAVEAGAVDPRAVVESVYADVDPALWAAAELSVRAQLAYLRGPT